jgi:hypothetical protein
LIQEDAKPRASIPRLSNAAQRGVQRGGEVGVGGMAVRYESLVVNGILSLSLLEQ